MTLMQEIDAYEHMRASLETEHLGKWALVRDGELVGTYDEFQDVADEATRRFGKGPYLIRKIGEGSMTLPASVLCRPVHA